MKVEFKNESLGLVEYNESFWTGKKKIVVNGKQLKKVGKNQYSYVNGEESIYAKINGNFFTGASLVIKGEVIEVVPKTKPLEWVLVIVPLVFILVWGNVPFLCAIFPMIGGIIGGAIAGGILAGGLIIMKKFKPFWAKLITALIATIIAVGLCALLGHLVVSIFTI